MEIDIFADPPAPLPMPMQPPEPRPARRSFNWLTFGLFILCAGLLLFQFRGCVPDITPGPRPDPIPTDGAAVLIAVDGDRMDSLSVDQAQAASSQAVQTWCEENDVDYRRYDVSDDLSREDAQWLAMMDAALKASPPNMVTVDSAGRGSVKDIPAGVDATIKALEKLK